MIAPPPEESAQTHRYSPPITLVSPNSAAKSIIRSNRSLNR